jgi:hypothetical protein
VDKTLHSTRAYVGIMGSGFEGSQFAQMDAKSARAYVMGSGLQIEWLSILPVCAHHGVW